MDNRFRFKNYNPLSLIYENTSETMYKNTQLLGKASLEIIEGLKWNVNYSFTNNQSTYSAYDSHNTQFGRYQCIQRTCYS